MFKILKTVLTFAFTLVATTCIEHLDLYLACLCTTDHSLCHKFTLTSTTFTLMVMDNGVTIHAIYCRGVITITSSSTICNSYFIRGDTHLVMLIFECNLLGFTS